MAIIGYKSSSELLSSLITPQNLIKFAIENQYDFIQTSDLNSLAIVPSMYFEAKKNNLRLIVGTTINVYWEDSVLRVSLYPKNINGYYTVVELLNKINIDNHKVMLTDISFFTDVFVVINIINLSKLDLYLKIINDCINKDMKCWVGVSLTEARNNEVYSKLFSFLENNEIKALPLLCANCTYPNSYNTKALQVLNSIKEKNNNVLATCLPTKDEINLWKKSYPYLFDSLTLFKESINFDFGDHFGLKPLDFSYADNLTEICFNKLKSLNLNKNYEARLTRELKVIKSLDLENYFLFVKDIVNLIDKKEIKRGPGRGSSNASLVCYLLGINKIDPIKYNLFFERFLNSERSSLPDIDIDIDDSKRNIIIQELSNIYQKGFCLISTHDSITNYIGLTEILKYFKKPSGIARDIINEKIKGYNEEKQILSCIENLPLRVATHPAGFVITSDNLTKQIPLTKNKEGYLQSVWNSDELALLGYIKTDLLSLGTLQIIDKTEKLIKQTHTNFDINNIPLNDENTFKLLTKGNTTNVFQLEGRGITKFITNFKPTEFRDLYHLIALYRPGSVQEIDNFIERKNSGNFDLPHQDLASILNETYGIIVFQEQIMQIASQLAGFSLTKADNFRRAISKKDERLIKENRDEFITGLVKHGFSNDSSEKIFEHILKFANYGFNKAHSIAYATLCYQTAYLKANYPLEFFSTYFETVGSDNVLTSDFIKYFLNAKIRKPNINEAELRLYRINDEIVLPLTMIKNLSRNSAISIYEERTKNGLFKNYLDFKKRTKNFLTTNEYIQLLKGNFFDLPIDTIIQLTQGNAVNEMLFLLGHTIKKTTESTKDKIAQNEREAFGQNIFYSSYRQYLNNYYQKELLSDDTLFLNKKVVLIISDTNISASHKAMFIKLSDTVTEIEAVFFNTEQFDKLKDNVIVKVIIKLNEYNNKKGYLISNLEIME